jgi:hypothetical protein
MTLPAKCYKFLNDPIKRRIEHAAASGCHHRPPGAAAFAGQVSVQVFEASKML